MSRSQEPPASAFHPLTTGVGEFLEAQAVALGQRPFLSFGDGTTFSYAEVAIRADRIRRLLQERGIAPGDRVALMLANSLFYPVAWLGVISHGAVAVPVNARLGPDDAGHIVGHSRSNLVISDDGTAPVARAAADRSPMSPAVVEVGSGDHDPDILGSAEPLPPARTGTRTLANVQYTSGTTGLPKGCMLSHGYWQRMGHMAVDFLQLRPNDRILTAQPFSYIDPLWNVMCSLQAGAHLIVLDGFHPSTFMESVARWKVNVFYCVGVMPTLLLKQPAGPWDYQHSLRRVGCSAIPPDLHRTIEERWAVPWLEVFGMTETGLNIGVADEDHDELVGTGCIGTPFPHCEAAVVDDEGKDVPPGEAGELRLRGLGLMDGYLDDPDATARFFREGWANTGDLVTMDDRGRIYFRGRRKEFVRRGGENISEAEVEFALRSHEDVLDCALTSVPDAALGEEVKAYVVLLDDRPRDPEALRAFLASKIASFKVPRYWEFREDLPRTPSERIAKHQLQEGGRSWRTSTYDARENVWLED
jgi:crotonobetaine/carnitine-CoA ligase